MRLDYISKRVPLSGARVLDVGCGGGLLSEALARQGAHVTAIDLAPELIKVARLHGLESGIQVDYRIQAIEDLLAEQPAPFDAIACMEMLEHVPDPAAIVDACAHLLKPGGRLFVSTINRTLAAFMLAVVGAEYVVRLLPKGTHQYKDFIRPAELAAWLRHAGLHLEDVSGMRYEPWRNRARLTDRTDINYLACAISLRPHMPLNEPSSNAFPARCCLIWMAHCLIAPPTCLLLPTPCWPHVVVPQSPWRSYVRSFP